MRYQNSLAFAKSMDRADQLRSWRNKFYIPRIGRSPAIYLAGNSLGLQPKTVTKFVSQELKDWARLGVEGHFHAAHPWLHYHKFSQKALAGMAGAKPSEVIAMNQLTVNLHLMMASFYRPTPGRFKIMTEAGAFSSDYYAFESQVKLHGYQPEEAIVELKPRPGEFLLRTEDIVKTIEDHAGQLALIVLGAVQYYTGQFFNIQVITNAGHQAGCCVGFDLAHAIGNVPLQLHQDGVDFAVWCGYKYLNSGPGALAGAFIHEQHARSSDLPRLAGWWGHDEKVRFQMEKGFTPMPGAEGWQVSNFPVLSGAAQLASLEIFQRAGMKALRKKSLVLTGYLEFLLSEIDADQFTIITPKNPDDRGAQLSLLMTKKGKLIFNAITRKGVIADWRNPDVIRIAPVPLYNTFEDVYRFVEIFKNAL
jgi:kynureninase